MKPLSKKSKKRSLPEHHDSLDAPIDIWNKVHEKRDLSWLLVKRRKINKSEERQLSKVWDNIYNEYINEFGFSESFLSIKEKEKHIADMQRRMIISNDRSQITFIEVEQQQLEEMQRANNVYTPSQIVMLNKKAVERNLKFQINMRTTTIREFYSYLEDLK